MTKLREIPQIMEMEEIPQTVEKKKAPQVIKVKEIPQMMRDVSKRKEIGEIPRIMEM